MHSMSIKDGVPVVISLFGENFERQDNHAPFSEAWTAAIQPFVFLLAVYHFGTTARVYGFILIGKNPKALPLPAIWDLRDRHPDVVFTTYTDHDQDFPVADAFHHVLDALGAQAGDMVERWIVLTGDEP